MQAAFPMLWTSSTVQQGCGRRLSSAWHAVILQLHRLGSSLCSLGVGLEVRCYAGRRGRGGEILFLVAFVFVLIVCACFSGAVLFALRPLCCLTRATADYVSLNDVDMFNSATGTWSTAQLSVARCVIAAASVGNVALFAGGWLLSKSQGCAGIGGVGMGCLLLRSC
jgi:hypothetical protein